MGLFAIAFPLPTAVMHAAACSALEFNLTLVACVCCTLQYVPVCLCTLQPVVLAIVSNVPTVQCIHNVMAEASVVPRDMTVHVGCGCELHGTGAMQMRCFVCGKASSWYIGLD